MTTIAIMPEEPGSPNTSYRAVAGARQSIGRTAGEALDAISAQFDKSESATLVVVLNQRPDEFFSKEQQERLETLMRRWRAARDQQTDLPIEEQSELHSLVNAEIQAASRRAASLAERLGK